MSQYASYVVYDPNTRELLGSYLQEITHEYYIIVSDELRMAWPMYMLNEDMTGLIKDPRYWPPEDMIPAEDPPVDPEPEDPVQSGN